MHKFTTLLNQLTHQRLVKTYSRSIMVAQKEATAYAQLRHELGRSGTLIDGVAVIEHDDNNRAMVATRELRPEHVVLRLPYSQLITAHRARSCAPVAAVLEAVQTAGLTDRLPDATGDDAAINLYLMHELAKGATSELAPWFASLPSSFVTPLTIDEDEMYSLLSGSPALYLAVRLREELREMYDDWLLPYAVNKQPQAFPLHKCTFERFMYVHSICDSRAFRIDDITLLAPFADMANHRTLGSPSVNLRARGWRMTDAPNELGLELVVSASSPISAGKELCISYGALANGQLLLHYGFAIPNNPADSLPITLSMPENDASVCPTKKLIFLHLDNSGLISLNHELTLDDPLPAGLLASTRLLVMDEVDIQPLNLSNCNFGEKISEANETAVKTQLGNLFHNMLDDYPVPCDIEDRNSFQYYCDIYINVTTTIIKKAASALKAMP